MKIDKRRSELPNLNHNFRDYTSGKYLTGYYIFSKNINEETLPNSALGDELADAIYETSGSNYYEYISEKNSPYRGRNDLYSAVFRTYRKSNFRISYANSTSPFVNEAPFTISCWLYLPNIRTASPDSDIYIFQKIAPAGAANVSLEFSLKYVSTPGDDKFVFTWAPTAAPATIKNIATKPIGEWQNPNMGLDDWIHVAVVIDPPSGGGASYAATDILRDYIKIYCNGYKENRAADLTFTDTWTPKTITNGDIIIGKGLYDNPGLTGDEYWNNFKIRSIAIWNTNLTGDEVYSIYSAAKQFEGSGVITNPPRVRLSELDNRGGRYPTIKNVGGSPKTLGKKTPFFDDTKTRLFWDYSPSSSDFAFLDYFADWQTSESRNYDSPGSGSLKFLALLTESISTTSGFFGDNSLTHPPHTGSYLSENNIAEQSGSLPGPIFNSTGSVWFNPSPFLTRNCWFYDFITFPVMNFSASTGTVDTSKVAVSSTTGFMIPDSLRLYKDNLTFVKYGGSNGADYEENLNPYINGTDGVASQTVTIPITHRTPDDPDGPNQGYSLYLENTPQTISVWVYPARDTLTAYVAKGSQTIVSKGLWQYENGLSGSISRTMGDGTFEEPPILDKSSIEYRLLLTGSTDAWSYGLKFQVGTSVPAYNVENLYQFIEYPKRMYAGLLEMQCLPSTEENACVIPDQWNHVVVSWDGNNWNTVDFYINGIKNPRPTVDNSLSASYVKVTMPTSQSLIVGATEMRNFTNQEDFMGNPFSGSINNLAMWDVKLTDDQAIALFEAASGSLGAYGVTDFKVSYPSLIQVDKGTNLPLGAVTSSLAQISGSLATPNKMPDIVAVGSVAREIGYDISAWSGSSDFSDNYTPFVESNHYIDNDSEFYSVGTTGVPGFSAPLKDKVQINVDITPSPELAYAGDSSYQGSYIYRNWGGWCSRPGDGEIDTVTRPGMWYWNFAGKGWDHVGLHNPNSYGKAVTNPTATPMYGRRNQKRYSENQTSSYFSCSMPSQFMPYNYHQSSNALIESIFESSENYRNADGDGKAALRSLYMNEINTSISHVGLPHNHNFAPFGTRYFATSSNLLKMSDYINEPILLEKIEIDLGSIIANQNFDFGDDYLCSSPFSAYTFFLYRQTQDDLEPIPIDEYSGVPSGKQRIALDRVNSGSNREIIGWSTAVFYNQFASCSLAKEAMTGSGIYNSAGDPVGIWNVPISPTGSFRADFFHAWDLPPEDFRTTKRVQFTGSMKLQFTPRVCGPRAQKTNMFTAHYPWSPPGTYNIWQTQTPTTAICTAKTALSPDPAEPGNGLVWAADVSGEPSPTAYSLFGRALSWPIEKFRTGSAYCGSPMRSYSPWIGSNTDQNVNPYQIWDPGSYFGGAGAPRQNIYSWPGGSTCVPYSASAASQMPETTDGSQLQYFWMHLAQTTDETFNNLNEQPIWNDSGFNGDYPMQVNHAGLNAGYNAAAISFINGPTPDYRNSGAGTNAINNSWIQPPAQQLLFNTQNYLVTQNPDSNHYPKFAGASIPLSSSITFADMSNEVEVKNTTFLLHPEDTLVLGVEKILVPPSLPYWGVGGYFTGSIDLLPSASFPDDPTRAIPDNSKGPAGRFYGKYADHHREHYHAGVHTASFLRITSENKSWLRLYGSLVKSGKQYFPSSTQQLTTDAVHEALHYDNPVLDQWEIAGENEYNGSLRTLYITGSMTRPRIGAFRIAQSSSVDPKISDGLTLGNSDAKADDGVVGYSNRKVAGQNSRQYGDMFGFNRNIRVVENSRIFYDSMTPKISEIWSRDGFQPATWYSSFYQGGQTTSPDVWTGASASDGGTLLPADYQNGATESGETGVPWGPGVGEWLWTRKYYYGWLMGHGTGSRSRLDADGTLAKVRYHLNYFDNSKRSNISRGALPGAKSPYYNTAGYFYFTINTGSTGNAVEGLTGDNVPVSGEVGNHVWPTAFPFEPRYKNIPRLANQDFSAANKRGIIAGLERPPPASTSGSISIVGAPRVSFGGVAYTIDGYRESATPRSDRRPEEASISAVVTTRRTSLDTSDSYVSYTDKTRAKNNKTCAMALFGRGESNKFLDVIDKRPKQYSPIGRMGVDDIDSLAVDLGLEPPIISRNRTRNSGNSGSYGVCSKPHGFKYGLINAVAVNPTAVYRGNSYGQFRDMLEQRPFTRYFDKKKGKMDRREWVVRSRFVEPTWASTATGYEKKSPEETQSSNLSVFSTSSLPYFDEVDLYPTGRNRGSAAADGNVNVMLTPGFKTAGTIIPGF